MTRNVLILNGNLYMSDTLLHPYFIKVTHFFSNIYLYSDNIAAHVTAISGSNRVIDFFSKRTDEMNTIFCVWNNILIL